MNQTDCLGLPYPECNPPLTKDASDIEQFRDLAVAVDTAVQAFADNIVDNLQMPPAVRLNNGGTPLVSTLGDNAIVLDSITFDNQPGNTQSDLTNGVIRIIEDGWYMVGSWTNASVASNIFLRTRILVNGDPATNFQGVGTFAVAGQQNTTSEDTLFLREGDGVTVLTRSSLPGTSVTYTSHVWCVQVAPNV